MLTHFLSVYNDLAPELIEARARAVILTNRYNQLCTDDSIRRREILQDLFEDVG